MTWQVFERTLDNENETDFMLVCDTEKLFEYVTFTTFGVESFVAVGNDTSVEVMIASSLFLTGLCYRYCRCNLRRVLNG